jgi:hypothetical protein
MANQGHKSQRKTNIYIMKHIKPINEVIRTKGMSREEESELEFKEAYEKGRSGPNVDYLSDAWRKVSAKYHLYDSYYLYEDAILQESTRESGNWYSTELKRLDTPLHVFKQKIFDRIEKLEKAFNKL